jgi:hypothetical protein
MRVPASMCVRACESARFVRPYANLAIDRSTSVERCAFSRTFAITTLNHKIARCQRMKVHSRCIGRSIVQRSMTLVRRALRPCPSIEGPARGLTRLPAEEYPARTANRCPPLHAFPSLNTQAGSTDLPRNPPRKNRRLRRPAEPLHRPHRRPLAPFAFPPNRYV